MESNIAENLNDFLAIRSFLFFHKPSCVFRFNLLEFRANF